MGMPSDEWEKVIEKIICAAKDRQWIDRVLEEALAGAAKYPLPRVEWKPLPGTERRANDEAECAHVWKFNRYGCCDLRGVVRHELYYCIKCGKGRVVPLPKGMNDEEKKG